MSSADAAAREFADRLLGREPVLPPLADGQGKADRSADLAGGNRASREGRGAEQTRRPDHERRRFASELMGHEFRDERYFD